MSQDIVHVPRPDQFRLRVGDKKVATTALVQAGVEEAWLTKNDIIYYIGYN